MLSERDRQVIGERVPQIRHQHPSGRIVVLVPTDGNKLVLLPTEDGQRPLPRMTTLPDARVTPQVSANTLAFLLVRLNC